jgi:ring-1,2-phenylacetyl-CoA epoxidase subunit PaaC
MNDDETAYEALSEEIDDVRWAYGTGFTDPLSGIDASPPADVDGAELGVYCVMLGDDALIMSHRLQEWVARAPELEEETALANVALDLLGQARLLLTRAGQVDGTGRNEDDFAFRRDVCEFRNVRLVEGKDTDFARLIVRLFVFTTWRLALFDRLRGSRDQMLAAIADKGIKELTYHRDYAADWVIRLGDGTPMSRERAQAAVDAIEPFIDELSQPTDLERRLAEVGVGIDPATVRAEVEDVLQKVLTIARLHRAAHIAARRPGRDSGHTEGMTPLLAELQSVARAHPGATW